MDLLQVNLEYNYKKKKNLLENYKIINNKIFKCYNRKIVLQKLESRIKMLESLKTPTHEEIYELNKLEMKKIKHICTLWNIKKDMLIKVQTLLNKKINIVKNIIKEIKNNIRKYNILETRKKYLHKVIQYLSIEQNKINIDIDIDIDINSDIDIDMNNLYDLFNKAFHKDNDFSIFTFDERIECGFTPNLPNYLRTRRNKNNK
jgi:hypothetical protein